MRKNKKAFVNSAGMKMLFVRPGKFVAGAMPNRKNQSWYEWGDEIPRPVDIQQPFFLAQHPIINLQYRQFLKETGHPEPKGILLRDSGVTWNFKPLESPDWNQDDQPVVCVTLDDITAFCEWLSRKDGKKYRLPNRDEWEYACRAGTETDYNWGSNRIAPRKANYNSLMDEKIKKASFRGKTAPVGSYKPNRWGFYDMHGNVNEATATSISDFTTVRGGSWIDTGRRCRSSSNRNRWNHNTGLASIGFRTLCEWKQTPEVLVEFEPAVIVKTEDEDIKPAGEKYLAGLLWRSSDLLLLRNGKIIMDDRCSVDGGKTWQPCARLISCTDGPSVQLHNGTIIALGKTRRTTEKGPGWGKINTAISEDNWKNVRETEADLLVPGVTGSFDDCGEYHDGLGSATQTILELPNGTLLATMYGFFEDNRGIISHYQRYPMEYQEWKSSVWIVKSINQGKNWQFFARLPDDHDSTRGGPCEPGMVRLANGDLLLACRTGEHSFPNEQMLFSRSKNNGLTWSKPLNLTVDERPFIGIFPQFCLMRNGMLAIIWGRTGYGGTCVAFSPDGQGKRWTGITELPFNTGMNDLAEIEPGVLIASGGKLIDGKWQLQLLKIRVRKINK